jgi:hypothetical protein
MDGTEVAPSFFTRLVTTVHQVRKGPHAHAHAHAHAAKGRGLGWKKKKTEHCAPPVFLGRGGRGLTLPCGVWCDSGRSTFWT